MHIAQGATDGGHEAGAEFDDGAVDTYVYDSLVLDYGGRWRSLGFRWSEMGCWGVYIRAGGAENADRKSVV